MSGNQENESGWGGSLTIVGVAGFAVLCCAGPAIVGTLGVGAIVATVTSWWILVPAVLVVAGIVAWYTWRRSCRVRSVDPVPRMLANLRRPG